jgi:hypothetical protein
MDSMNKVDTERKQFRHEKVVDVHSNKIVKKNFVKTHLRRVLVTLPTIFFAVGVVVVVFTGYRIIYRSTQNVRNQTLAAAGNAVIIIVFGIVYQEVALMLVNWENHRYDQEWENSLILKTFAFQFINAYIALFAIAFEEKDYQKLATNLATILVFKQVAISFLGYLLPMLKIWWRKRNPEKEWDTIEKDKNCQREDQLQYVIES